MKRFLALQKIVELKSFTKAAKELGYTQSAISQMVSSLEDEFKITLLNRIKGNVILTKEGEKLYPFIEKLIYHNFSLEEKIKEIKGLEQGCVRIGTLASISCYIMPKLIKEFKKNYPNVEFIMHQGDYSSILEWIKMGAVDFGFISFEAASGIKTTPFISGEFVAVLPKNHSLASKNKVKLKDLTKDSFILLEEGHYSEPLEEMKKYNLLPNTKYVIHDDYTIMSMVEEGLGISILAELVTKRTKFDVVFKKIEPKITRNIAIGFKDKAGLSLSAQKFIDFIKSSTNF